MTEEYFEESDPKRAFFDVFGQPYPEHKKKTREDGWSAIPSSPPPPPSGKIKDKNVNFVQKYTKPILIAESVIVADIPQFAVARNTGENGNINITLEDSVPRYLGRTEYKPFEAEAYLNKPYTFNSTEEFDLIIEKAKHETRDTLYKRVKGIWTKYIDADDFHISICAADTIFTYFQDKVGMTHYLFFVGNNSSGKSNNLLVLKNLAYRNFTSTDMTAANIYQFLGSGEEGQGTLCEDEADGIEQDRLRMGIHKNGYITGFPVSRIDTSFGRKQIKYNTFCFKAFAAEKFPDPFKAKGFNQRVLEMQCYYGDPEEDLAEILNSAGDDRLQHLKDELEETRNLLLAYRLLHFNEKIPDIKLNIKGREKQLFKPVIRVFQSTETLSKLLPVISNYVTQKREANDATFNAFLYTTAVNIIAELKTTTIPSTDFWNRVVRDLEATEILGKKQSCDSTEFGIISQKEIIQTLEHVFGVKKKRTETTRYLIFNPSKLQQLGKVYSLSVKVEVVKEKEKETSSEMTHLTHMTHIETGEQQKLHSEGENHEGNFEENPQNTQENEVYTSPNVSEASEASFSDGDGDSFCNEDGTSLSEEEKAEARAKYDATRSRIVRR